MFCNKDFTKTNGIDSNWSSSSMRVELISINCSNRTANSRNCWYCYKDNYACRSSIPLTKTRSSTSSRDSSVGIGVQVGCGTALRFRETDGFDFLGTGAVCLSGRGWCFAVSFCVYLIVRP